MIRIAAACLAGGLIAGCAQVPAPTNRATQCILTAQMKRANRTRPWGEFEFDSARAGGPMYYNSRRCFAAAVDAGEDYLAHGPALDERQRAITTFHMARNLARTGDHTGAARLAAGSLRYSQATNAPLDWNSYVRGFYAFLVRDGAGLASAHAALLHRGGEANGINAAVLARALKCPDRPFLEVEEHPSCAP